jgi:hypothetical protein
VGGTARLSGQNRHAEGSRHRQGSPYYRSKIDNQLLRFILERRHPDYRERVDLEAAGAVEIHKLMANLNAGRQRVAEEKAEREAQQKVNECEVAEPEVPSL